MSSNRIMNRSKSPIFAWDGRFLRDFKAGRAGAKLYEFKSNGNIVRWGMVKPEYSYKDNILLDYPAPKVLLRFKSGKIQTYSMSPVLRKVGSDRWVDNKTSKILFYIQGDIPVEVIMFIWQSKLKYKSWR